MTLKNEFKLLYGQMWRSMSNYSSKKIYLMEPDEENNCTPQGMATYSKIKGYVKDKYGVNNVHTSYIAQIRRMRGLGYWRKLQ